jgi:hypothetical protein
LAAARELRISAGTTAASEPGLPFSPVPRAVALAVRRPLAVIAVALAIVLAAGWFAAGHFAMNTDTATLIAPTVDWRRDEIAVDTAT